MPEQEPQPIDYAAPAHQEKRLPFMMSAGLSVYLGLCVLLVLIFAWVILPRFAGVFADFGTELPLVTKAMLGAGYFLQSLPGLAILLAVPIVIPKLLTGYIRNGKQTGKQGVRALVIYLLVTFLMAALVLWAVLAVFMPMVSLMQSVSSPGGGKP